MSKVNLKKNFIDGQVLHGQDLNLTNEQIEIAINIIDGTIVDLESNKADMTYVIEQLLLKVDKEENKGLSSNDYTNVEQLKLNRIEGYAQINKIERINNKTPNETKNITLTKEDMQLDKVQNIRPVDMPISNATQEAISDIMVDHLTLQNIVETLIKDLQDKGVI